MSAGGEIIEGLVKVVFRQGAKRIGKMVTGAIGKKLSKDEAKEALEKLAEQKLAKATLKAKGLGKAPSQVAQNKAKGDAWEKSVKTKLSEREDVVEQITLKTPNGKRTRVDFLGKDKNTGEIKITEAKSSETAPLTKGQKGAFPEIEESGAVVVGKGKEPFVGGTQIPPTKVKIVRPGDL